MADNSDYDVIIIGAGAAGLSLLLALEECGYSGSVKLIEKNIQLKNDRMWSFWHKQDIPHYIQKIITQDWHKWALSVNSENHTMRHSKYRYSCVKASSLVEIGLNALSKNSNFDIEFNCDVEAVYSLRNYAVVKTSTGKLSAKKVIDTRPPPLHHQHNGMFQCFYGEEITTDKDIFGPTTAKLMEQLACSELGIEFIYILPFNARHALVEFTCFSATMIDTEVLKTRLKTYIETNLQLSSYQIVRIERAVLPMYHINNNKTNKQPYLAFGGITGGAMRASTGYSFLSSQRWAVACANELKHKKSLSAYTPVTLIYQKMDALMLRIIRKDPSIGVTIFSRMFTKVSAERFVRFMTEKATITDFIVVIWAMPKRIFLTALLTRSKQKSPSTKITGKDRE